jgi:D-galactarolactone cycloisomerase
MIVTKIEVVRSAEPTPLPEPWVAAWTEPSGKPKTGIDIAYYRLHTDEGIVGIGPYTGADLRLALGADPTRIGAFFEANMGGRRSANSGKKASGIEIALWDILGKAAGLPVIALLGGYRDRVPVYAATSRLLSVEEHVRQVQEIMELGFPAVKLRLHRPDPWDDLRVVAAVRDAVGNGIHILVDANQNNYSVGYPYWSRRTALQMARELDALDVFFLEEPLPRSDLEGLAEIANSVEMFIAGGEHTPTAFDWREQVLQGAYDILQPDLVMGGNMGITGALKVAAFADYFGRLVVPHVLSSMAAFPLCLAPSLHAMASVPNCPLVEYPYDPPVLTAQTMQPMVAEPLLPDDEGCITVPDGPGLGVVIDEEGMGDRLVVTESASL